MALRSIAKAAAGGSPGESADKAVTDGLFATVTNVSFDNEAILRQIETVKAEKAKLVSAQGATPREAEAYDMARLWANENEDIRSLKSLLLFGLRGMAAYAHHARALGKTDGAVNGFFYKALAAMGGDGTAGELLALSMELGGINLKCMELLDAANTGEYGDPVPIKVSFDIEPGPFIVVSGHDLRDLELILEQTEGTGVNVYTHGEMLPAHGYLGLKKYPHLKGNFGTAWQNQQREFDNIPAPVLFTANCLMPPGPSYSDRVFTAAAVACPGHGAHRRKQRLFPGHRKGAEAWRLWRAS